MKKVSTQENFSFLNFYNPEWPSEEDKEQNEKQMFPKEEAIYKSEEKMEYWEKRKKK